MKSFLKISAGAFLLAAVMFSATAAEAARVYDFRAVYGSLGYPSPDYFGSTEDQVMDLETYISKDDNYYGEINGYLRYYPEPYDWYGTSPESAAVMVERIDRVIERAPEVPGDMVVFRGLGLDWHGNRPFDEGEEFTDKAYVSTSLSFSVARYFAVEKDPDAVSRRAVFAIYFTRHSEKGILVDQGEDELMLGHGRRFRVMAKKEGTEKYDLYLVQACAEECETALRQDAAAFWYHFRGERE